MQIFALHHHPSIAAKHHCNAHIHKMVIEYAQILSFAHRRLDGDKDYLLPNEEFNGQFCYKGTKSRINNPCTIWASKSVANYYWLYLLYYFVSKEYTFRYQPINHAMGIEHTNKAFLKHHRFLFLHPQNICNSDEADRLDKNFSINNLIIMFDDIAYPTSWPTNFCREEILNSFTAAVSDIIMARLAHSIYLNQLYYTVKYNQINMKWYKKSIDKKRNVDLEKPLFIRQMLKAYDR